MRARSSVLAVIGCAVFAFSLAAPRPSIAEEAGEGVKPGSMIPLPKPGKPGDEVCSCAPTSCEGRTDTHQYPGCNVRCDYEKQGRAICHCAKFPHDRSVQDFCEQFTGQTCKCERG